MHHRLRSGPRLSRRALITGLGASGAGLLMLASAGCQAARPASPSPLAPAPTVTTVALAAAPSAAPPAPASAPTATTQPAPSPASTRPAASATVATASTPRPATKAPGAPDLVVIRGGSPAEITRAAVEALGGIAHFVPKGSTVVIKPNICTAMAPEYAATTNPEVVETLVKLCQEAGASRVKVLDYPWGSERTAYAESGIEEAVKRAGAEMVSITPLKWKKTAIPKAKLIKSIGIYEDVLKADVIINVPIAKDHGLSRLTLGMKNLMGVVDYREQFHMSMGQSLSDLLTVVKPAFTLVDAVRILTANGPGGGLLDYVKKLDTVIASTDIVAVDAYSSTLFGLKPDELETVRTGQQNGLGTHDLASLKIAEVKR